MDRSFLQKSTLGWSLIDDIPLSLFGSVLTKLVTDVAVIAAIELALASQITC